MQGSVRKEVQATSGACVDWSPLGTAPSLKRNVRYARLWMRRGAGVPGVWWTRGMSADGDIWTRIEKTKGVVRPPSVISIETAAAQEIAL